MSSEQNKRKTWSREETLGFLKCYLARKEEFSHVRKKKTAYSHVLEDMISQGLTSASTTTSTLESRMRTLLGAYKSAKDNARQTGASPCTPPYMEEMDEIFGDSPIISNVHTLQLGHGPVEPLIINKQNAPRPDSGPGPAEPGPSGVAVAGQKRKNYKQSYYEQKLELKKKCYEDKKKQREGFLKEITNCFEKKMDEKLEIERNKVSVLEKLLN